MEQGNSEQQAVNRISGMIDECYKRCYSALANMPVMGLEVDRELLKFVEACRNVALENLYWRWADDTRIQDLSEELTKVNSFKTGRYLGAKGDQVRHEWWAFLHDECRVDRGSTSGRSGNRRWLNFLWRCYGSTSERCRAESCIKKYFTSNNIPLQHDQPTASYTINVPYHLKPEEGLR